jgi:hypothetical protein
MKAGTLMTTLNVSWRNISITLILMRGPRC